MSACSKEELNVEMIKFFLEIDCNEDALSMR